MASGKPSFFAELKRRNVLRAAVLYIGAVWAVSQGISQLTPALDLPAVATRWFLIACVIGFPFWIAFAWFYEFTPHGIQRESAVAEDAPSRHSNARKLDFAIIGVMAVAIVLLASGYFVHRSVPAASHVSATSVPRTTVAASVMPGAAQPIPAKSIAVLPFVNEGGDKSQQYFSDGLSGDLITALSQFAGLKVISRDSAFQFRDSKDSSAEIGRTLGVAHLLEGSVERIGGQVRIGTTLVNASDGSVVWSHRYDKPYKDLFALQDDITKAVSNALKVKLLSAPGAVVQSERPPSGSLAAYNAYLQGKFDLKHAKSVSDIDEAIAQFTKSTKFDPNYALAYARIATSWIVRGSAFQGGAAEQHDNDQARAAVTQALRLNPKLATAHEARGLLLYYADFDWDGAEAAYRRALELAPGNVQAKIGLANIEASVGHVHSAVALAKQAVVGDPLSATSREWLAVLLSAVGQPEAAAAEIHAALGLVLAPQAGRARLAIIEIQLGEPAAALATAKRVPQGAWRNFAMAMALQVGSNRTAADTALKDLIDRDAGTSAYQIARVYALRRDPTDMFKWLYRAWTNRDPGISLLLYDPFILRYRDDPRFAAFCKKVGLPDTTDAVAMK